MVINVEFKFLGIFRRLSGKKSFQLKIQEYSSIKKVINILSEKFSPDFKRILIGTQNNDFRPNALILINGKEISVLQGFETEIKDKDEIVLVPLVHGG